MYIIMGIKAVYELFKFLYIYCKCTYVLKKHIIQHHNNYYKCMSLRIHLYYIYTNKQPKYTIALAEWLRLWVKEMEK